MTQAELIDVILKAPADRVEAILRAARGTEKPKIGTIREAAQIMECSERTIERYVRMGLLNQIRFTKRRIRYDLSQVSRLATQGVINE